MLNCDYIVTYDFPHIQSESIIPEGYVPCYDTLYKLRRERDSLRFQAFLTAFYDTSGKRQKFASALWDLSLSFDNAINEAEKAKSDREFQETLKNFQSVPF